MVLVVGCGELLMRAPSPEDTSPGRPRYEWIFVRTREIEGDDAGDAGEAGDADEGNGGSALAPLVERMDCAVLAERMQVLRKEAHEETGESRLVVAFTRWSFWKAHLRERYDVVGYDANGVLVLDGEDLVFGPPYQHVYGVGERCHVTVRLPSAHLLKAGTTLVIRKKTPERERTPRGVVFGQSARAQE